MRRPRHRRAPGIPGSTRPGVCAARTSRSTIRRALAEIRDLLDQHEYHIEPATAPPGLPARIPPYVPQAAGNTENEIKTAC